MLRKIHVRMCGENRPWWRHTADSDAISPGMREASIEEASAEGYAAGRQQYLKETGRKPPAGAAE